MHDLVIDNAVVIDGLGGPARPGGTAIDGGRITAIGTDLGPARQRIDAGGLVLAPGIVDIHTHYGRSADLGSLRHALDGPRRHHRRDRQLRLHHRAPAVGVHGVWVNGVRTVDERGVIADCGRPGRLLRRFAA